MEISEVRRRLRGAIDKARREAAERRTRTDAAARDYETFLSQRAAPVLHQVAAALKADGHQFKVFTPESSIRLAAEGSPDEFIELSLDSSSDPPAVIGRTTRGRGRRTVSSERVLKEATPIGDLTEEDVLAFIVEEIPRLLER
ncbi:MAG: hypothetical protein ACJ731_15130 [Vicinamibacterales bacterium]